MPIPDYQAAAQSIADFLKLPARQGCLRLRYQLTIGILAFLSGTYVVKAQGQVGKAPYTITIVGPKESVHLGTPCTITATTTNTTDVEMRIALADGIDTPTRTHFRIHVKRELKMGSSIAVPHTPPERTKSGLVIPQFGSSFDTYIKPGKSFSEKLNIAYSYQMTKPGVYTVQLSRHVSTAPHAATVWSNKIKVTVIP